VPEPCVCVRGCCSRAVRTLGGVARLVHKQGRGVSHSVCAFVCVSGCSKGQPSRTCARTAKQGRTRVSSVHASEWFEPLKCLVGKVGVILLQHARVVRVGVGHGDHRVALCVGIRACELRHALVGSVGGAMQTARLREGGVVDAGEADAERDGEGGLVGAQGHLVQDDGLCTARNGGR